MNRHLGGRDEDGWKIKGGSDEEEESMTDFFENVTATVIDQESKKEPVHLDKVVSDCKTVSGVTPSLPTDSPKVPVTDLLRRNARTIQRVVEGDEPIQLMVRPIRGSDNVGYAGSDASGEGFGFRDWFPDKPGEFVFGYWLRSTEESSSNWREMRTAFDKLKLDSESGRLFGREVWFGTDNSTLEKAFYKGYSSSPELYEMVEEMRAMAIKGSFILRIVHIAGTRMIELGIDGLSKESSSSD